MYNTHPGSADRFRRSDTAAGNKFNNQKENKMKVTFTIRHTEMVTPPRCRKPRPQEGESEIKINIREVSSEAAPVAFVVSEYDREPRKVRSYRGKLYRQVQDRQPQYMKTNQRDDSRPFWLNQAAAQCNWQWLITPGYNWSWTLRQHKENAAKRAENYIIVAGEAYERTGEPYYYVTCFGLGHNHGGTGFFIGWADSRDRKTVWGLTAADPNKAIERAVEIALARGDTESVDYIRKSGNGSIKVLMPDAIKRRYAGNY